jgi:hypothetical protein
MHYTIYKITNIINNKYYIGKHQTKNLDDDYMGSGKILKLAIKKYGIENFKKEILHIFANEEEMNAKEKELVVISEESYNLCDGGPGGFSYINRTIDFKQRNKNINSKKNYKDPIYRKKISDGVKKTYPTRKQPVISDAANLRRLEPLKRGNSPTAIAKRKETYKRIQHGVGNKNSQFGTCWVRNSLGNKKIKKEELDTYISNGYVIGRKMSK